jgi:hypothetical protein
MANIHAEAQIYRKFAEMAKLLNLYLNHFRRAEKHALCQRIRNTAYEMYDLITEGQKRYHKKTTLSQLDITHERLRMQLHLAYELGYFRYKDGRQHEQDGQSMEEKRYLAIGRLVDEIGRMIGGWIGKLKDENRW